MKKYALDRMRSDRENMTGTLTENREAVHPGCGAVVFQCENRSR
jgi:hypothetical protein